MSDPFTELYAELDRQGPGAVDDVAWAVGLADVPPDGRICDAGCGTGADIAALLQAVPQGHLTAVDKQPLFVDAVLARYGEDPRVTAYRGDMAKLKGPFHFIWCAGAMYFLGVAKALHAWRPALVPGGAVAFSIPALFVPDPSELAQRFWGDYAARDKDAILAETAAADYGILGTRVLSEAAWDGYYQPLTRRIAALESVGIVAPEVAEVLRESAAEIDLWRQVKNETGYLLVVARPE